MRIFGKRRVGGYANHQSVFIGMDNKTNLGYMKYCFFIITNILISFFSFSQIGSGTSILVIVTKDTIFIGADSKRKFTHLNGTVQFVKEKKIWNVGETFLFMAGNTIVINEDAKDTVFNVYKIMQYFVSKHETIESCFKSFNDSAIKKFNWITKNSKQREEYIKYPELFDIGLAKFVGKVPKVLICRYRIDKNYVISYIKEPDLPVVIPFPLLNGMSHHLEARKYWDTEPKNNLTNRDKLIKMILIEINKDSIDVGEPINTVAIYPDGHTWYQPYTSADPTPSNRSVDSNDSYGSSPYLYKYLIYLGGALLLGSAYYFFSKRMSSRKGK
jgi:hypothetical protein